MTTRVVIVDPEPDRPCGGSCPRLESLARAAAPGPLAVTTLERVGEASRGRAPDLVVLRTPHRLPIRQVLGPVRDAWRAAPVLAAVCDPDGDERALDLCLELGMDDFCCCPFEEAEFLARVRRLLPAVRDTDAAPGTLPPGLNLGQLVGESAAFLHAVGRIPRVAGSGATVLIAGETGVGKELFARAIHYNGPRRHRPFIPVNCSGLPDQLFENELFGHARGAYTDASRAERGLLAEAADGTVFLDEVDTLSAPAQAKLLRFLQDRVYRPLGSTRFQSVDVRIIAATNADLREMTRASRFRCDLFHRLNVLSLHVPPLRERVADILLLARHFLRRFAEQYERGPLRLSQAAARKMLVYPWPGNVRELEGLLHRAVVFGTSDVLAPEDLELPESADADVPSAPDGKDEAMGAFERAWLAGLMDECAGNVSHAARRSGKDRRTVQRLLHKHGIRPSEFRG